jgi:hypothetical protein
LECQKNYAVEAAWKHVQAAVWLARCGSTRIAACHLEQALWPPKSYMAPGFSPKDCQLAAQAYQELRNGHGPAAVLLLERVVHNHDDSI